MTGTRSTAHRRIRLHVWAGRCSAVVASLAALAFVIDLRHDQATPAAHFQPNTPLGSQAAPSARPHYRYSVVPGGIYSREELTAVMDRDAVVAAHYGTVESSRVRATVTPAARLAHVSYRMGDRVFWTRKPVRIPAGETLLTDGDVEIRARCGNAVSDVAREPVSDVEPLAAALDQPLGDSSMTGARDAVGSELSQMAHVPFLLSAQGGIPGQDVGLPAELRSFNSLAATPFGFAGEPNPISPVGASWFGDGGPSFRGQLFGDHVIGGTAFLAGIAGPEETEETDRDDFQPGDGRDPDGDSNADDGTNPGDGVPPLGGSDPGDGTIPKEYPGAEDLIEHDEEAPLVPEPGTLALVALGLAAAAARNRRR